MKIRFSKVATLFLAGAAVLAAGCTDYQSDINDIYVKIDELASKESVASLQSQVVVLSNALDALKSDHSKDITALQSSIDALKSADAQFTSQIAALDGKIGENAKDIASLKTSLSKTDETVANLSSAFESYKNQVNSELSNLKSKDTELGEKIQAAETALRAEISALSSKVDAEIKNREDADKVLGDKLDAAIKEAAENLSAAEARLNEKLATESTRAQLAEQALKSAIDAEAEARAAGDNKLAAELAKEVERAKQAEADINAALTAEIERAKLAEKALEDAIAAEAKTREAADLLEVAIRKAADEKLQESIDQEAANRENADEKLQGSIDQEAANRENADEKLQESIDALKAALAAEIKRAAEVENALKVELHNTTLELDAAIKAEAAARAADDKKTADALQSEIDRAKKAEDVLNRTIETERERASRTEALLKTAIADVKDALNSESDRAQKAEKLLEADLAAEEAARLLADTRLDNLLKDEKFARETADAQLAAAIAAELERAENAESALQLALEAEAVARQKEDKVLQAVAEGIDNRLVSLQNNYNSFKSDVYAIIGGLSQRISANNAAISNINNVTIPAIYAQIKHLQDVDSLLRVDMVAGDKYVLDSLNVVKAATEKSIAALQDAVKDIVAVNKDQSDSLKAAFAKFNDYVLTSTFKAYQANVEAMLKAKADTAALNAAVKRIVEITDAHDVRIVALEAYKNDLVETILPGLEAADKALRVSLDSLGGVVADVQNDVADLQSRMTAAETTLAEHTTAIAALNIRTSALEEWQKEAEQNIQSLLSRIRSVEFVPDYTDKYITIEQVVMPVYEFINPTEYDFDLDTVLVFNAPSEITYKVYPTEMADSLVNYFKAHAKDGAVYFDVINVKGSGSRFDATDEVKRPELEILDVNKSDRTAGAITFTVKAKNVDDFGKLSYVISEVAEESYMMPDKISFFGNLIGLLQNRVSHPVIDNFKPFLSSALVIEGVDGGAITSEYNIWTPGIFAQMSTPGFATPEDDGDYYWVYGDDIVKEVEYTDTESYSILDENNIDIYSRVSLRGEKLQTIKFDEAVKLLGIDVKADVATSREYACDHTGKEDAHEAIFIATEPVPSYGISEEDGKFTPEIDEFIKLKSQLDPKSDVAVRKAAIGDYEFITYDLGINGTRVDEFYTVFQVTKTKAKAVVDTVVINWEYAKDVAVDAAIYNRGSNHGTGVYSRTNIVLSFDADSTNLTQKGVKISDFVGASAKLQSYTVTDKAGKVVADLEKGVEDVVIKVELNAAKNGFVASISNFKWDETYTIKAVYDLDDAIVSVSGVFKTIDRPRTPVTVDFGTFTQVYKKDMNFNLRGCMTYGKATPLKDHNVNVAFEASPVDVQKLIVDLYGPTAKVPEALAKDLWAKGHEFVGTADAGKSFVNVKDTCNNAIFAISYLDYTKPVLDTLNATFFTYYGQEIDVVAYVDVVAPKYDFRHNIYRVFDNGTTEAESHPTSDVKVTGRFYSNVEPAYNEDKWNKFSKFNVAAINLPEAFVVVDETMSEVAKADQDAAGLVLNFTLEDELDSNTDDRSNTFITIADNKLMYHGYEEKVAVHGAMAIKNSDGHLFTFPTSFDKGFEAIYADVLEEGDEPTVGRYADYEVVKFNPLHSFRSTKDVTIQLFDAKKYTVNVLSNLSLLDQRKYDANDPTMPKGVTGITNGVELFESGFWKVGTGKNLFANGVKANVAYDIDSEFKKNIADDVHVDIKNAISLTEPTIGVVKFEFDYTQQMVITKPVVVDVNAELTHPWVKDPLTATVKVTIKK